MRVIIYAARPRSDACLSGIVDEAGFETESEQSESSDHRKTEGRL